MAVEIEKNANNITAYIEGDLDHHTAKGIREALDEAVTLNMPDELNLNFSRVTFMDSSGIGLVMGRYKLLSKSGGRLKISGMSPQIFKVMKLSGIEKLAVLECGGFKVETNK